MRPHASLFMLLFCALLSAVPISAWAKPDNHSATVTDALSSNGTPPTLVWCLYDLPPRHFYKNGQQPYGPMVDMMQELAKRSGFILQFTPPTPLHRCEKMLADGQADLMTSLLWTEERDKVMHLFPFDIALTSEIYRHPDSPALTDERGFNGRRVILLSILGYPSSLLAMLKRQDAKIIWAKDLETCLALLLYKHADYYLGPYHHTEVVRRKNSRFNTLIINAWQLPNPYQRQSHLGMSKASQHIALKAEIERQLEQMVNEQKTHFYD